MKTITKSLLMTLLIAIIVCAFSFVVSAAQSGTCGDNVTWTLSDDGVLTIRGSGEMQYCSAFERNDSIKKVVIEEGITRIWSFSGCRNIESVKLPNSITKINNFAFSDCTSLTSIELPNGLKKIGNDTFQGCTSLSNVKIPESVTTIEMQAFEKCTSLTSVVVPNSVKIIEAGAFSDCKSLSEIKLGKGVTSIGYNAFYNTGYYNNPQNWDNDVLYIGEYLIFVNKKISGSYTVKDGTKLIASQTFFSADNLTDIIIPDSVEIIGDSAFNSCKALKSVVFGNCVVSIGERAFFNCPYIESITIPESVKKIDSEAFAYCTNLADITIGNDLIDMYSNSFSDTAYYYNDENWENDVLYMGSSLVKMRKGSDVYTVKQGTKSISEGAFRNSGAIREIILPDSLVSINNEAFSRCNALQKLKIPNSVIYVNGGLFASSYALSSVYFPDSQKKISSYMFFGCEKLDSVYIPEGVEIIWNSAFEGCKNLSVVYYGGTAEQWNKIHKEWCNEPLLDAYIICLADTVATDSTILVDGKPVSFTAYNIGGNNYFKLRDIAQAINNTPKNFSVDWNEEKRAISLKRNNVYMSVGGELECTEVNTPIKPVITNAEIYIDEEKVDFVAFNINGNNYFKLRDIAEKMDFGVVWDEATRTVSIKTSESYN